MNSVINKVFIGHKKCELTFTDRVSIIIVKDIIDIHTLSAPILFGDCKIDYTGFYPSIRKHSDYYQKIEFNKKFKPNEGVLICELLNKVCGIDQYHYNYKLSQIELQYRDVNIDFVNSQFMLSNVGFTDYQKYLFGLIVNCVVNKANLGGVNLVGLKEANDDIVHLLCEIFDDEQIIIFTPINNCEYYNNVVIPKYF